MPDDPFSNNGETIVALLVRRRVTVVGDAGYHGEGVDAERWRGDDVEVERCEFDAGGSGDAVDAVADDAERVPAVKSRTRPVRTRGSGAGTGRARILVAR